MIDVNTGTYPGIMAALVSVARPVLSITDQVDLAQMRAICERFQTLGPVLAPTAYQRGGAINLDDQAVFLRALDDFAATLRSLDRRPSAPPAGQAPGEDPATAATEPPPCTCIDTRVHAVNCRYRFWLATGGGR